MSLELEEYKNLFPDGPNWDGKNNGLIDKKLKGISLQAQRDNEFSDGILKNYLPFETTLLNEQEELFRLPTLFSTDEKRLERINGAWSNISPSTYTGFNEILQLNGFTDLVVRPLGVGEDPTLITDYYKLFLNGNLGSVINNYETVLGNAVLGEFSGTSNLGKFTGTAEYFDQIEIPSDEALWGMIFVIEGAGGGVELIPDNLKSSFEYLIYKHKPLFMMGIARVEIDAPVITQFLGIDDDENLANIDDDDNHVLIQGEGL